VPDAISKIQAILGEVVLIPIRAGTKRPAVKHWQERTRADMKDPAYLRLFAGKNIGVLLGKASGGLCTIDIDQDPEVEPFLANNPRLRNTTRTKRVRGCNIWIYVDGEYPPNTKHPFGEWRADGNQTVIYGRAMNRSKGETEPTEYQFLNDAPPIHVRFDELVFPDGCFETLPPPTLRLNPASCVPASLDTCVPASLHNNGEKILENINARNQANAALRAKYPGLAQYSTML